MKVLINTPDLKMSGGVSSYINTINEYFSSNVTLFEIGKRAKNNKFGYFFQIIKDYYNFYILINESDFDVIHINPSLGYKSFIRDALFVALAKLLKKRIVVFFHGWDMSFESFSEKYLVWLYKITYFKVDAIIVLANQFKEKLISIGYTGDIYVETTVVDDVIFDRMNIINKTRDDKIINILFLSRIETSKGIYELIDALSDLNKKHDNILLTISGDGSELDNLIEYASDKGVNNIKFTGFVSGNEKNNIFEHADIFVLPSYSEGMPLAILEAMAYGLPILTTPVGGLKDFFKNGEMGFFVGIGNSIDISNNIDKIICDYDLKIKMSNCNYIYSKKYFMASNVVSRLERIYAGDGE